MRLENDDDGSFTQLAMGSEQQPQQFGQPVPHGLYVVFYTHPKHDPEASLKEGRPIYVESEYVRIMVPGDKSSIIERPARIGPDPRDDNYKYAQEYQMFKQGVENALVGTPLAEWPAVSRSQVKELEHFNVRTVEQLAGMPDTAVQNFAGVSTLRAQAQRYMEDAKGGAVVAQMQNELETRDNTIATMNNQIREMQASIASLQKTPLVDMPTVSIPAQTSLDTVDDVEMVPAVAKDEVMPEYVVPGPTTEGPTKKKRRAIKS